MPLILLVEEMSSKGSLDAKLSTRTPFFGLKLWVIIGICVCAFIVLILSVLSIWVMVWRKSRKSLDKCYFAQMPNVSKELKFESVGANFLCHNIDSEVAPNVHNKPFGSEKMEVHLGMSRSTDADNTSQCSSVHQHDKEFSSHSGEGSSGTLISIHKKSSSCGHALVSPLIGLPEFSHLGWGYWFTLRDLEFATNHFSKDNVLGEGGYGVVYKGRLINGAEVAIKKLLNNPIVDRGQAEKEFRVELEAIGHLRHKNLVRLLGYCVEGIHRMLVYEYVNNGNLEQWLHGAMHQHGVLSWEARMKTLFGTAKALAYLHEAIEPKVVHRDIKSSNILIDKEFNAKISDFGLAKLLGSEKSHVTTRVMGTFGYVAPEYASTGLLNEKSDIYSFGVLMLEAITGRDPVDYGRPANEVNLVEWLKVMVANGRAEEVVDPNLDVKPTTRALKRVLLTALRCVNPDSEKRHRMSQVVQMLEADEFPVREDLRSRSRYTGSREIESLRCSSINMDIKVEKSEC